MLRPVLTVMALCSLACGGDKIPTPWSETEGRQEVVVDPTTGEATATTSTSADGSQAPTVRTSTGTKADSEDDVSCDGTLPTPEGGTLGKLECGGSVTGSSDLGVERYGDDFFQGAFCTPRRNHYDDARDVLYKLDVPPNTQAVVTLSSPCADLDVFAVAWQLDGYPSTQHVGRIRECEMDTSLGGGKLTLTTVVKAQTYLVGVDGKSGDEGNFKLSVSCGTYR